MPFLALAFLFAASIQGGSTYSIAGEVRDSEGKPAAGVNVSAYTSALASNAPKPPGRGAVSDSDGKFVISLEKPGKYILIYDLSDKGYVPQYISFFRDPDNPPPQVILTDTTPTANVTILMSKNGVLSGEALDGQTRLPIEQADFRMCHANNRAICWPISAKSATGNFSIPTPFVPFVLRIAAPGFEDWLGVTGNDGNTPIQVPAGTNLQLHLLMKRRAESVNKEINDAEKNIGVNLPAPKQISPDDNAVFDIFPRLTKLEWAPVEGAVSYTVEVDYCEFHKNRNQCVNPQPFRLMANSPTSNITGTSYEFKFIGAQPGRWRVCAVDKEGRDGFKSSWRTFVYLR